MKPSHSIKEATKRSLTSTNSMMMKLSFQRSALVVVVVVAAASCYSTAAFTPSSMYPASPLFTTTTATTAANQFQINEIKQHLLQPSKTTSSTRLQQITPDGRADMDIVFGSEYQTRPEKSEYGLYEDDVDEDQLDRQVRRETVQALIREQDEEFRQQRKKKQWGKFANVTTKKDLEPLLAEERQKIELGMFSFRFVPFRSIQCNATV